MICPIKNKAWDKLEGEYGVDAYAVHRMEGVPLGLVSMRTPLSSNRYLI